MLLHDRLLLEQRLSRHEHVHLARQRPDQIDGLRDGRLHRRQGCSGVDDPESPGLRSRELQVSRAHAVEERPVLALEAVGRAAPCFVEPAFMSMPFGMGLFSPARCMTGLRSMR